MGAENIGDMNEQTKNKLRMAYKQLVNAISCLNNASLSVNQAKVSLTDNYSTDSRVLKVKLLEFENLKTDINSLNNSLKEIKANLNI